MAFSVYAYPASQEFVDLILRMQRFYAYVQLQEDALEEVSQPVSIMLQIMSDMRQEKEVLSALVATPGINEVAQTYYNSLSYNVTAETQSVIDQINTVITWITNNYPDNDTSIVDERVVYIDWTQAQYTDLHALLVAFRITYISEVAPQ